MIFFLFAFFIVFYNIIKINILNVEFPNSDRLIKENINFIDNDIKEMLVIIDKHVKQRDVAVDIGCHYGFFTKFLSQQFETVHAFDFNNDIFECFKENMKKFKCKNVIGYHQSRAEYFILLGQDDRALNQLEFALQLTQNNFQVSESLMNKIVEIKKNLNNSRGL